MKRRTNIKQVFLAIVLMVVRCEAASFSSGTDLTSALQYYKDFLEMFKSQKLGWIMNDYYL